VTVWLVVDTAITRRQSGFCFCSKAYVHSENSRASCLSEGGTSAAQSPTNVSLNVRESKGWVSRHSALSARSRPVWAVQQALRFEKHSRPPEAAGSSPQTAKASSTPWQTALVFQRSPRSAFSRPALPPLSFFAGVPQIVGLGTRHVFTSDCLRACPTTDCSSTVDLATSQLLLYKKVEERQGELGKTSS